MKNFVFISPTFPKTYYQFPLRWKRNGGTSLCIGEDNYDSFSDQVKESMDAYYQVSSLENYDEVYRGVAWFAHKYGKIDWLESNNEYWLNQDAKLRTDFNITTGVKSDEVSKFRYKSIMKQYYQKAGCKTARFQLVSTLEKAMAFVKQVSFPIIVKPDDGMGANATWKIHNQEELEQFFIQLPQHPYIMEEFLEGYIESFDGIVDQNNNIIFQTSHVFPTPIMNIVHNQSECFYYNVRNIPQDLLELGEKVIHAFDVKGRFFHTEYFRLTKDKDGLGKKGDLVGLEVNMRPPGGFTTDMMNFAHQCDVYDIYAKMAMNTSTPFINKTPYYCVYVGRRNSLNYKKSVGEIINQYREHICMYDTMSEVIATALANAFFIAIFSDKQQMDGFVHDVFAKGETA